MKDFQILKVLEKIAIEILNKKVTNQIFKRSQESYQSSWFLIKKSSGRYRVVNAVLSLNTVTIKDVNLSFSTDELSEEFSEIMIILFIDIFSDYNQISLDKVSRNFTVFYMSIELF
jgi:hypothetical protein